MNLLIDTGHPAHVHLFKNLAIQMQEKGHYVFFSCKKDKAIIDLLKACGFPYISLGKKHKGLLIKYFMTILHLIRLWRLVVSKKIDIGIGVSGLISFISAWSKMQSICLDDDDSLIAPLFARSIRNADTILTPSALRHDKRGKNHIAYDGYHELAYLHPVNFTPDKNVLKESGLKEGEKFFLLRFNAFKAHHDVGEYGLNTVQKQQLIEILKPHAKVFISSEINDPAFSEYKLNISPEKIHSLMYYAEMFIGDSQSMTSEAAVLGTPALKCNTFAGRLSIPNELENKYELCYSFHPRDFDKMLNKIQELLEKSTLDTEFQARRQKMLSEKIDVTAFMVWFIENYPESIQIMKDDAEFQMRSRVQDTGSQGRVED
jgi:uncharacterized protein